MILSNLIKQVNKLIRDPILWKLSVFSSGLRISVEYAYQFIFNCVLKYQDILLNTSFIPVVNLYDINKNKKLFGYDKQLKKWPGQCDSTPICQSVYQ